MGFFDYLHERANAHQEAATRAQRKANRTRLRLRAVKHLDTHAPDYAAATAGLVLSVACGAFQAALSVERSALGIVSEDNAEEAAELVAAWHSLPFQERWDWLEHAARHLNR